MQAICFTEKGVAVSKDLRQPELLPGHALVRVRAAGLCHADIDVLHVRMTALGQSRRKTFASRQQYIQSGSQLRSAEMLE